MAPRFTAHAESSACRTHDAAYCRRVATTSTPKWLVWLDQRRESRHPPSPWASVGMACVMLVAGIFWTTWAVARHQFVLAIASIILYVAMASLWVRAYRRDRRRAKNW
jgi:hypothetical protein